MPSNLEAARSARASPQRRGGWWWIWRGMALFASGFGLIHLGTALGMYWLELTAFVMAVASFPVMFYGFAVAYWRSLKSYWRWFVRESERNERELAARDARDP